MFRSAPERLAVALLVGFSALVAIGVTGAPAGAAFPGGNGKLAFNAFPADTYDVYVVHLDGSGDARLTRSEDVCFSADPEPEEVGGSYHGPSWSPDGRWLAMETITELPDGRCTGGIAVMRADGTDLRLVVETEVTWIGPSWSPDGRRLVYGQPDGIWAVGVDGGSPVRLLACSGCTAPTWSPDGASIAFSQQGDIRVVDTGGESVRVVAEGIDYGYPDWSPDGTRIAFSSELDRLGVVGADASGLRLGSAGMRAAKPAWSPDGTHLAFESWDGGPSIWTVRVESLEDLAGARRVVDMAFYADWQPVPPVGLPVGVVDPATGRWHLARTDGSIAEFYFGNPGDFPIMGDWDCDGVDTPGLYRRADGYAYLRNSNTQGIADVRFFFGDPGDVPLAGDFDGDGCDTVSIYRPALGRVYVINELGSDEAGLGAADFAYYFGDPGDKPFAGDFDGDGVDTVGLHRESTGLVYFRDSHTQGIADTSFIFGDPGDRLTCGDWNGDEHMSPALFRPGDATWYFRFTNTQGNADAVLRWGEPDWLPVAGSFGLG